MDFLNLDDLAAVPKDKLPMMILSDNLMGLFGLVIKLVTKSFYSHFMWLYEPGQVATQWFWYRSQPVTAFKHNSLKVFWCPAWSATQREALISLIGMDLAKGKWSTRYDVIGAIAEAFGIRLKNRSLFCSEHIAKLGIVDQDALLWTAQCPSPTPEEVNVWLKAQRNPDGSERYPVYCRVVPG